MGELIRLFGSFTLFFLPSQTSPRPPPLIAHSDGLSSSSTLSSYHHHHHCHHHHPPQTSPSINWPFGRTPSATNQFFWVLWEPPFIEFLILGNLRFSLCTLGPIFLGLQKCGFRKICRFYSSGFWMCSYDPFKTGFKLMVTLQSGCVIEILTLCRMNKIFF